MHNNSSFVLTYFVEKMLSVVLQLIVKEDNRNYHLI